MKLRYKLAALATALLCGCAAPTYKQSFAANYPLVRLFFSPLPVVGFMAVHPWFITHEDGKWNRWEVWHINNLHGKGLNVYKNLNNLNHNIGWGDPWLEKFWVDEDAKSILKVLETCRTVYPHRKEYWLWPGPNSNSFVSWVLEKAGVEFEMPFRALGDGYR